MVRGGGDRIRAPLILNLSSSWRSEVSYSRGSLFERENNLFRLKDVEPRFTSSSLLGLGTLPTTISRLLDNKSVLSECR